MPDKTLTAEQLKKLDAISDYALKVSKKASNDKWGDRKISAELNNIELMIRLLRAELDV